MCSLPWFVFSQTTLSCLKSDCEDTASGEFPDRGLYRQPLIDQSAWSCLYPDSVKYHPDWSQNTYLYSFCASLLSHE